MKPTSFLENAFNNSTLILLIVVFLIFGTLDSNFLSVKNCVNILIQASFIAIVATGMTFVLLTAGIDLSVGSIMFLSGVISGKMVVAGYPVWISFIAVLGIGALYGLINAWIITRYNILPFIVTLATQYIGRGLALYISQTRAVNLPENYTDIGSSQLFWIPFPILIFILVLSLAVYLLNHTALGRQIYAVGNHLENATKAGIDTKKIIVSVYVISGLCASLGGFVAIAQIGAIAPQFGEQREFHAIAAAVLGGASLFGGQGNVFPGTVLGAVLIQTVESGLNFINADPYMYRMVTSFIIFFVVLIDAIRNLRLNEARKKKIRVEPATG